MESSEKIIKAIPDPEQYPGVELAYPIARESYDAIVKRLDTMDTRIQSVITIAVGITLAIPAATIGKGLSYKSPYFLIAIGFFAQAILIGLIARLYGYFKLVNPEILYNSFLHLHEWDFKKEFIYWAGKHFQHNNRLLRLRGKLLNWMSVCLAAEAVFLALWMATRF